MIDQSWSKRVNFGHPFIAAARVPQLNLASFFQIEFNTQNRAKSATSMHWYADPSFDCQRATYLRAITRLGESVQADMKLNAIADFLARPKSKQGVLDLRINSDELCCGRYRVGLPLCWRRDNGT
jgi:hypothetical protein